jgi:Spy/CpxP family protein refolding chaperone
MAGLATEIQQRPLVQFIKERFLARHCLRADLGVTEEQREEIRGIIEQQKGVMGPAVRAIIDSRRALGEAVIADPPDEAAIRAAAEQLGNAVAEAAVELSYVVPQVREVLTDDQIETLRSFREDRQASVDDFLDEVLGE